MRKRVGLARAIALRPKYILYDEPTTGLDPVTSAVIDDLMLRMQRQLGVTSIVITHDMHSAYTVGTRIAMLYEGRIRQVGTVTRDSADDGPGCQAVHRGARVARDGKRLSVPKRPRNGAGDGSRKGGAKDAEGPRSRSETAAKKRSRGGKGRRPLPAARAPRSSIRRAGSSYGPRARPINPSSCSSATATTTGVSPRDTSSPANRQIAAATREVEEETGLSGLEMRGWSTRSTGGFAFVAG